MDKFSPKNKTEPFLKGVLFCTKTAEVGLPGFEPGSRAPEAQSLDQASRQPLFDVFLAIAVKCNKRCFLNF